MMRFVPATLCSAALVTLGMVAATPGVSTAALDAMAVGRTATLNGVITGGPGVKLSCGGVTAEVHDSSGKIVSTAPTTPNGAGGCAFAAKVPAGIALSSCAGRVALGAANQMGAMHTFEMSSRSVVNGHERIGTLGSSHIFSTIVITGAITTGGASTANITVGAEP
jgi:hypothetical protein